MWKVDINTCLLLSSVTHLILVIYGEFHDRLFEVKYTDIDYRVFSDAANLASAGQSPFDRDTYRYTPILAWILIPCVLFHSVFGKIIFCSVDVAVGYLIYRILLKRGVSVVRSLYCSSAWLFNPMSIVISSRGNAESIMAFLVLYTLFLVLEFRPKMAGLVYGFSVHFKIYPVIFAVPFYVAFGPQWCHKQKNKKPTSFLKNLFNLLWPHNGRLPFVLYSIFGFAVPTTISYLFCGQKYIDEAFLYHINRRDVQHNFSPYFYILRQLVDHPAEKWVSLVCFLPQLMAISYYVIKFHRRADLAFCIFMQTYAFVTFNKVCTSQYFIWYLSLLPVVIPKLKFAWVDLFRVVTLWACSQAVWLFAAWTYEFRGADTLFYVWLASLYFLASNIFVLKFFRHAYHS